MLSRVTILLWLCSSSCIFCYCIATTTILRDTREGEDTLETPGKKFQLGFFSPNGTNNRYVGIWYYSPSSDSSKTVVWVANRDNPLVDFGGVLALASDNLQVFDRDKKSHWSTNLELSSSNLLNISMKLMDTGNLVLVNNSSTGEQTILWQSFGNPTDTFLPGMTMNENVMLTSWTSGQDPSPGNFTFELDQDGVNQFVILKRSIRYWKSGVSANFTGFDQLPPSIFYLLTNFTSDIMPKDYVPKYSPSFYNVTRLVMHFSGQIQFYRWEDEKRWVSVWAAPRDRCTVYNTCGSFGSCNDKNNLLCKCLPGFKPSLPENWNNGDFSGGCSRISEICGDTVKNDTFLKLNMIKLGNPDSQFNAKSEDECGMECLNNCQCLAYSYEQTEFTGSGSGAGAASCWIWSDDLKNLQEEYDGGRTINVRIAAYHSDIRTCEACGTNIIPYPLSVGPKCGDDMYLSFQCNISTGQINFQAPSGSYRVTSINPAARQFVIQTKDAVSCMDAKSRDQVLLLNRSLPFYVTSWCNASVSNLSLEMSLIAEDEIEIGWEPPPEPSCSSPNDCVDWPNSFCNETGAGKKKCICSNGYQWNGLSLNCSRDKQMYESSRGKMPLSLMIAIILTVVIGLILSSTILYVFMLRRKFGKGLGSREDVQRNQALYLYGSDWLAKELIDSGRYKDDSAEGIDVPFFDLESILVATKNFSNANKLGQGGFGPVYKGKFPGGQEIAVKRLSSCSGQGLAEFKNEVMLIAKLQHRNLVRLLGYCLEGEEKMLLYEYMPNKSLDSFIFDRKLSLSLDWERRYNIILGIARGLLYLHQDSRLRIIHRDLKTSNILLDEEMNPKISDFGLARIFGGKETAVNTNRVVGTYGYMSPEYALDGLFSFKSDVFSFGVVLLEIVSGKRNTGFYQPEKSLSLLGYAWHLWKDDKSLDLLDKTLSQSCNNKEFVKCIAVGLLCVQEDPSDRPTMSNVVLILSSDTVKLPVPKQPAFVVRRGTSSGASSSSRPETFSNNELTITLEDGR